ncbi:MAG: 4-hydroxythreonine-4-phosphate dehydrogenase PdxA [Nitrospiraceae bacterium]|nr:4-hydroxythreonine-4-phosphate dehydrogenase PdxA [Nitrospiraceae bacterium]
MKKIAITMGDAAGVGPEIIIKAVSSNKITNLCTPIIIADRLVIEEIISLLQSQIKIKTIQSADECISDPECINLIDLKLLKKFHTCRPSAENGKACVSYIQKAVELALNKEVDAIVTAPISKESLNMAGLKWPGHTEMLAEFTGTKDYAMMLIGGQLKVLLVTIHTSIKTVPKQITKEKVLKTILIAKKAADMLDIKHPRIAVAGLNPHAGEAGMFGDEEIKEIVPAIAEAKKHGVTVTGPYPPDTVFYKAYNQELDIVICMYHDQGLIPLKMTAFEEGVNITIGLPIIRTSPDHGTAYDIAWKGIANPSSMIEAIKLAVRLRI